MSIRDYVDAWWLTAEGDIVEMCRGSDCLDLSPNIELFDFVSKICNRGVGRVISTECFDSFLDLIRFVNIID